MLSPAGDSVKRSLHFAPFGICVFVLAACGGGSGSSPNGGGSLSADIATVCGQMDHLSCKPPDCIALGNDTAADAQKYDCTAELDALLKCMIAHPPFCVAGDDAPQMDPACATPNDTWEACPSKSCIAATDASGCHASCASSSYSASCTPTSNGLSCTCTSGPNSGQGFTTVDSCSDSTWIQAIPSFCHG
jgi:hypothetical protein